MKKFISILLVCIIAVTAAVPVSALDGNSRNAYSDSDCPLVIVRGMMFEGLKIDLGTENEYGCTDKINVGNIASALLKSTAAGIADKNLDTFTSSLCTSLYDVFAPLACDKNGNSALNVSVEKYPGSFAEYEDSVILGDWGEEGIVASACERYGSENVYYFTYDWRLDPYEIAAEINETVETAKAEHDTDKVNLVCASMGGVMVDAYLYRYGSDSINSLLFLSSTFKGTYCTTDLLQGKAKIVEYPLITLLKNSTGNNFIISAFIDILANAGVISAICKLGNAFIDKYKDMVYDKVLRDTFGTMPSLWALVLPSELDNCINYMFPTEELKTQYSGVISKAYRMNEVMKNIDTLLLNAQQNGCKISVVASYNKQCVPFYESAVSHGDGTLESPLMLGGATMASLGSDLGNDYAAADSSKVSPDNIIDMSTALFPESTWAIKNGTHVPCKQGSDFTEFMFELIDSDIQPSIENMQPYSQFMTVDENLDFIS